MSKKQFETKQQVITKITFKKNLHQIKEFINMKFKNMLNR